MSFRAVAVVLISTFALVACGARAPDQAAGATVTIKHAFGEVGIQGRASRVVALGANDLAIATALGANVVGAIRNYNPDEPNLPYLAKKYGGDVLGLDSQQLAFEKIAAYQPDLILATGASALVDQGTYDKLSKIAPTVAYEKTLYGATMEAEAELIGKALGRSGEARELIDDAHARVEALKRELPGLAGRSYLFGQARGTVLPLVVGKENLSTKFMTSLGLKVPDEFANDVATDSLAPGTIGLSYEQARRLDSADVLFMAFAVPGDRGAFEGNAIVRELKVVKEGRYQATSLDTAVLLQAPNVAGVGWLLDQLKPTLKVVGS